MLSSLKIYNLFCGLWRVVTPPAPLDGLSQAAITTKAVQEKSCAAFLRSKVQLEPTSLMAAGADKC